MLMHMSGKIKSEQIDKVEAINMNNYVITIFHCHNFGGFVRGYSCLLLPLFTQTSHKWR